MPNIIAQTLAAHCAERYKGVVGDPGFWSGYLACRLPLYYCTLILRDEYLAFEPWTGGDCNLIYYHDPGLFTHLDKALHHYRARGNADFGDTGQEIARVMREIKHEDEQ